ncbi:MAG TPA: hypothetical protein PKB00_13400 [Microthrixaceae bacterium]|nr:hypothetical protein [Microthrixaceae bacterium]HNE35844.1 hypothetical protein [Microthrixaceae bacterium]HNH94301.1 hypothetical protein [Microthrixaceae bacterium]
MHILREAVLAIILIGASALVVDGVAGWSVPAAKIVGGILAAGLAVLFLVEAD